jgi:hypothetical protein
MFSEEQTSNEERGLGEWRWMNALYECGYECMKKQLPPKPSLTHAPSLFCNVHFSLLKKRMSESNTHFAFFSPFSTFTAMSLEGG